MSDASSSCIHDSATFLSIQCHVTLNIADISKLSSENKKYLQKMLSRARKYQVIDFQTAVFDMKLKCIAPIYSSYSAMFINPHISSAAHLISTLLQPMVFYFYRSFNQGVVELELVTTETDVIERTRCPEFILGPALTASWRTCG